MVLTLERLGNGAAYLVHDQVTSTTILLGSGEVKAHPLQSPSLLTPRGVALDYDSGNESGESGYGGDEVGARQYARDLKHLMQRENEQALNAIFITDYRPESCFMLPYITEKCPIPPQQPPPAIYLTHSTRAIGPHMLTEYWFGYYGQIKDTNQIPYDLQDITNSFHRTTPLPVKATVVYNESLKITSYHAGHVAGGCVFNIEIGASSLLYVNGFNLTGGRILLPSDIPRLFPSLLITNSAYAVAVSETRTVMEREFMKAVLECVQAQGKIVIPIYRLGFFYEIVNILFDFWKQMQFKYPIYVSDENMEYPSRFSPLLRHSYTPSYQKTLLEYFNNNYPRETIRNTKETPKLELFDWNLLQNQGPFVLFTGPATISQGDSFRAVKAVASDPKNLIVLSEACTPGNINYILYADPQRKEISKRLGVEVACGVHYLPCGDEVDAKSIVQLAQQVAPRQVVLDHVLKEDLEFMTEHIGAQLKTNQELDQPVRIVQIKSQPGALTVLKPPVDIPVRIHKSMFNHPKDVKGILIAENRRKLMLVTESNAVRRLKKKKHTLSFEIAWKQTKEPVRKKKRNSRAASSMSFLLAEPATSDDDEVQEEQPQADVHQVLEVLEVALRKWLVDVPIERRPDMSTCLILKSVLVSITADWQVLMEWTFEDEELAGRVLGIAKQIVEKEYSKKTES